MKEFFKKVRLVLSSNLVVMPLVFVLMFLWAMPEILIWNQAFQGLIPVTTIVLSVVDVVVKVIADLIIWKAIFNKDSKVD